MADRNDGPNDDWEDLEHVEIKPTNRLSSLISRLEYSPARLWVGELTIVVISWVTDLKASHDPTLYMLTLFMVVLWAYLSTRGE